jgi:polyphosphate kinase
VSDRITVRSIVGRFLEHSRVYWFGNGGGQPTVLIGSADLMERNLDRRVEVLSPVKDPAIAAHLHDVVLDAYKRDTERAHVLAPDGTYRPQNLADNAEGCCAQTAFLDWYAAQSK